MQATLTGCDIQENQFSAVTLTSFYQLHQQNLKQSNDFFLPQLPFWPECLVQEELTSFQNKGSHEEWGKGLRHILPSSTNLPAAFPGSQVILMHAIGHGNDGDETQLTAQSRGDYSELGGRVMDTV